MRPFERFRRFGPPRRPRRTGVLLAAVVLLAGAFVASLRAGAARSSGGSATSRR